MARPHDRVLAGSPWISSTVPSFDPVESLAHTTSEGTLTSGLPPEVESLLRARDPDGRERAWRSFLVANEATIRHALGRGSRGSGERFTRVVERLRGDNFRCLRKYPGSSHCRFATWLCIVIRRLDMVEDRRTDPRPALGSLLAKQLGMSDSQALEIELKRLEPRERLLLRLRVQQGLSARRISVLMGYASASHVRRRCEELYETLRSRDSPA